MQVRVHSQQPSSVTVLTSPSVVFLCTFPCRCRLCLMPIRCERRGNRYATCKKEKGKGNAKIQKETLKRSKISFQKCRLGIKKNTKCLNTDRPANRTIRFLGETNHQLQVRAPLLALANESWIVPDALGDVAIR